MTEELSVNNIATLEDWKQFTDEYAHHLVKKYRMVMDEAPNEERPAIKRFFIAILVKHSLLRIEDASRLGMTEEIIDSTIRELEELDRENQTI